MARDNENNIIDPQYENGVNRDSEPEPEDIIEKKDEAEEQIQEEQIQEEQNKPTEKENPFERNLGKQRPPSTNNNKQTLPFERELRTVDLARELANGSAIAEEDEQIREEQNKPTEKENPFERNLGKQRPPRTSNNKQTLPFERELRTVDLARELANESAIAEADEDDEIDAVYDVRENKIEETDKNYSPRLHLTDFYGRLNRRLQDADHEKEVRAQLSFIFRDAGVENEMEVFDLALGSYLYVSKTMLETISFDEKTTKMHDVAPLFFSDAYDSLNESKFSTRDKIIVAQRVADLMLRNYSPIAFVKDELDHFAHDFVLNDKELLQKLLEEKGFEPGEIERLVRSVDRALSGEPDEEPELEDAPAREVAAQNENPELIDVPAFYNRLQENIKNENLTAQVKREISDILKESGVGKNDVSEAVADNLEIIELIEDLHQPHSLPEGVFHTMHDIAKCVFNESYGAMESRNLSPRNRLVAAQRVADVILKNYSPVTTSNGALNKYADNYVIQNPRVLKSCLRSLNFHPDEIHEIMQRDLMAELAQELETGKQFRKAQPPAPEQKEQPPAPEQQVQPPAPEQQVQPPAPEQKEQPPAPEQQVQPPAPEQQVQPPAPEQKEQPPAPEQQEQPPAPREVFVPRQPVPNKNTAPIQDQKKLGAEWVNMTELDAKLERLTSHQVLGQNSRKNIVDALKEAGMDAAQLEGKDDPLVLADIIKASYDPQVFSRDALHPMREIAKNVFLTTYDALTEKGFAPKDKILAAQKIANIVLKNYSPATGTFMTLDKYTEDYVIRDESLLKECKAILNIPMPGEKKEPEKEINAPEQKEQPLAPEQKEQQPAPEQQEQPPAPEQQEQQPVPEPKKIDGTANVAVFMSKLKDFNKMYKLEVNGDAFAASVIDAWELMKSGDAKEKAEGKKMLGDLFKDTLKKAFDVEKNTAYDEHRIPEFSEITKSANELLRASMFAFTDLYHNPKSAELFSETALGGLNAKELGGLTVGKSRWSMNQKSQTAWNIQSKPAKSLAEKWLKEERPYEKMITEMNSLIEKNKKGSLERVEALNTLAAAEWLLINNEKMLIEDPEDPLNPMPNWGNRYWKSIVGAREALGIDPHTSMRELIQGEYSAMAGATRNKNFNEKQMEYYVVNPKEREKYDVMENQKLQFATLSADTVIKEPDKKAVGYDNLEMTTDRMQFSVDEENEKKKMKEAPKSNHFIVTNEKSLTIQGKKAEENVM